MPVGLSKMASGIQTSRKVAGTDHARFKCELEWGTSFARPKIDFDKQPYGQNRGLCRSRRNHIWCGPRPSWYQLNLLLNLVQAEALGMDEYKVVKWRGSCCPPGKDNADSTRHTIQR